jgi:hypothetical protein
MFLAAFSAIGVVVSWLMMRRAEAPETLRERSAANMG